MKFARNETVVGSFLLIAILASAGLLVAKGGHQGFFGGSKHFSIKADDGHSLREGAPVRMSGVDIGTIERIKMDAVGMIDVDFRIEPDYAKNIRQDTRAVITEPPILGSTYVLLKPGPAGAPELASGGDILPEDDVPLLDKLSGTIGDLKSIVSRVNVFVEDASKTMKEVNTIAHEVATGKSLSGRLVHDQEFGADVADIVKNAAKASADLADATGAIQRREGAIGRILKDDTIVKESEALIVKTRESLGNLDKLSAQLTTTLDKVTTQLDTASGSMNHLKDVIDNTAKLSGEMATLVQRVNEGKGTLGKMMNDDAIFVEAKGVLKEFRESVQDLREQAPINSFIGVVFSAF